MGAFDGAAFDPLAFDVGTPSTGGSAAHRSLPAFIPFPDKPEDDEEALLVLLEVT